MARFDLHEAKELSEHLLRDLPRRWAHVQTVGKVAEDLERRTSGVSPFLAIAGWLHDIGYSHELAETGFHPVDGARYLREAGWPEDVVRLVAHHTGAKFEASERGLTTRWKRFAEPEARTLDALCLADLTSGPDGTRMTVDQRIEEILSRYESGPVYRAVTASAPTLRASARRAAAAASSPDKWCRASLDTVTNS